MRAKALEYMYSLLFPRSVLTAFIRYLLYDMSITDELDISKARHRSTLKQRRQCREAIVEICIHFLTHSERNRYMVLEQVRSFCIYLDPQEIYEHCFDATLTPPQTQLASRNTTHTHTHTHTHTQYDSSVVRSMKMITISGKLCFKTCYVAFLITRIAQPSKTTWI